MTDIREIGVKECAERLLVLKKPTVVTHVRPDGDTVGSACALVLMLRALGKETYLLSPDKIPDRLRFLLGDVEECESTDGRELVAIDVASPPQLGRLSHLSYSLIIDHHECSEPFADYCKISDASSAGEVLFLVAKELEKISDFTLNPEIAYNLYASISSDTGGFIYSNATADTYRLAAELIDFGIDYADINHRLFNSKSKEQIRAEGLIATKIQTAIGGRIAYASLSKEERESCGIEAEHFETAIDVIRSVKGAEIAIFVKENADGTIKASLRSTGFNVAEIAAEFSGGGHIRAAGCSPVAKTADDAARQLINEIQKRL